MNRRKQAVSILLRGASFEQKEEGYAFAPANIALIKYWGKRDSELHLPTTSSLSLSLPLGTTMRVRQGKSADSLVLDGVFVEPSNPVALRLKNFLDLLRPRPDFFFAIESENSIPMAAGLASSASSFAALVLALDDFLGWGLTPKELSKLARLGSGSASRSLYKGFALWHKGEMSDGSDSFAEPLDATWPELRLGLLVVSKEPKELSSGDAMASTRNTSPLYQAWVEASAGQLSSLQQAIDQRDFTAFGTASEANALGMHATMLAAVPGISFWLPETLGFIKRIWKLRQNGLSLYCTLDAGPNVKVLFLERDETAVRECFNEMEILLPF